MATSGDTQLVELGVSHRFVREHDWVVNAITGWLSAYFMEDARFRLSRRYDELETGTHVWVCEIAGNIPIKRLIARLMVDLPDGRVHEPDQLAESPRRYVIDLPADSG